MSADSSLVLLLSDEANLRLVLVWPQCVLRTDIAERGDRHSLSSTAAQLLGAEHRETFSRVSALLALGLINQDGTVSTVVTEFIERLAMAKMAGLGAFNPELVTAKYLAAMPLEARMSWMEQHHLLDGE